MADVPTDCIAYVDETGIDTCIYREYGWSERGKPLVGTISGRKFKRTSIVAAQMGRSIFSPMQFQGTMDSTLFEQWFGEYLLPCMPPKTVIVMDNASFHRKRKLLTMAENAGFRLIFLPPYSPELNPVEKFWVWLKRFLRKTLSTHTSFDDALRSAFQVR
ncbi:IS630 family transposase [Eubacteriales bacterium OttesenSCG-928-A19]|nr:IS630 family transposase [Eubacteriales bacterium OttesenSCG-928-A19]